MAKIAKKLTDLARNTPLMKLSGYSEKYGLGQPIVAKLESFNSVGNVKDRLALSMIEDAEAQGVLKSGATIIEPTSGNTGVGLATVAASIAKAGELRDRIPDSVILQQFENPANAVAHERMTGEEIWRNTDGGVAVFAVGVGTGGTICGVARRLAQRPEFKNKKIVALLPDTGARYLSTELFASDAYPLD